MSETDNHITPQGKEKRWHYPARGQNPGTIAATTPGSFANKPSILPGRAGAYTFSSPDTPGMPPVSTKTAWDFMPPDWSLIPEARNSASGKHEKGRHKTGRYETGTSHEHHAAWQPPNGFEPTTQLEYARMGIITKQMKRIAEREGHLTPEQVRDEVAAGRMVIPANKVHLAHKLDPVAIGRASRTKINANIGASPLSSGTTEELEKMRWAQQWGADTIMDLSTGGNVDECRKTLIENSTLPIGTVPIYSMILNRSVEDLTKQVILDTLRNHAQQGVDYVTIHAGLLYEHLSLVRNRLAGIVSRGGSLLAKWMLVHNEQNPMYTYWDDICDTLHPYDVTFSIGDGCRPGGLADATDDMQLYELQVIAELTERAWRRGMQVMVEGPGHVPFDQIEYNMKLERSLCHGAPFYVLGPLVTDIFPGYDHITSAIGATAAAYHGAAMLCYVTPKEHLSLPKKDDVKQGCIAYKIAAHAADVALGIESTRDHDDELTNARAALDWEKQIDLSFDSEIAREYRTEDMAIDTDYCAMCGHDWCAVRISRDIKQFVSKTDQFISQTNTHDDAPDDTPDDAETSTPPAISKREEKQVQIIQKKSSEKPACHSDNTDKAGADVPKTM